jgi:hypothetical protein
VVNRCKGANSAGAPCSAQPVRPDGYCYWHSPQTATERAEARRRGGHARSNAARARKQLPAGNLSVDELRGVVGVTIAKVLTGDIEPGAANSVANLTRAYVAIIEVGEFEERLVALEAQAGLADRRMS